VTDNGGMAPRMDQDAEKLEPNSVDFFGVKLKVNNPRLAALLNSSVTDDVQVIGVRARDAIAGDSRGESAGVRRAGDDEADLRDLEDQGESEGVPRDEDET
jgi:hypothetical protein